MEDDRKTREHMVEELEQKRIRDQQERAAREVWQVEEKYRALFEGSGDAVYFTSREGEFVDANQSTFDLFGYTREEMIGLNALSIYVHPGDRERFGREIERHGSVRDYEVKLQKKDGTEMDCLVTATVRLDQDGSPAGYQGIIRNITDRKRMEEALRSSEERFRSVVEAAIDGIVLGDSQGKIIGWNAAARKMFGYEQQEVLDKPLTLLMPERYRDAHTRGLERVAGGGQGRVIGGTVELEGLKKDNTEFPLEISLGTWKPDDTRYFVAIVRDISERKRAQQAAARLASIVESSDDAIVGQTLDNVIVSWNRGAEQIYGYSSEEIVGRHLDTLIPAERVNRMNDLVDRIREGSEVVQFETIDQRKNGERFDVSLTISPVRDKVGNLTGVSWIARDITERKLLQEELIQAQKMEAIGQLAGGVAHDMNNMLTPILGFSERAAMALPADHPARSDLQQVQNAAKRASTLIRQLLIFSRRQATHPAIVDLNHLMGSTSEILRKLIGEDVELVSLPGGDVGLVKVDQGQIEQVLMNMAVNARDAMPEGGKLCIRTANVTLTAASARELPGLPPGPYVQLSIADTGTGMDDEVKSHIFEPFFTTKEPGKGTGLGLATCYSIVKQNNGGIRFQSELGRGTTFNIYLPRVEGEVVSQVERDESDALPTGTETVLLVEDEPSVRGLAARVLGRLGYTVLEAANGPEALRVAQQHGGEKVHLLLTDVVMPQMGGRILAARLRTQFPRMKVLFTSGYLDEPMQQGVSEDDLPFLPKPFTLYAVAHKVRSVLDSNDPT